jgi:hypothetical protein
MIRIVLTAFLTLLTATTSWAQASGPAQTAAAVAQSSTEKVRENPTSQYILVKTVVGKAIGLVDARALPVEPQGYNLLKYCWAASNVLGDWAEGAGLTGDMVVRALETYSWQRDLARAGYPVEPLAQAIGRYEAMLVAAGFTEAARAHALAGFVIDLEGIRRTTAGTTPVHTVERCEGQRRSFGLNYTTAPEDGRARFIPYVLHQICQSQQLDADDPVRCNYWMDGKTDGPMSFAGETVYSVRWLDGATATGRFDPEQSRRDGSVTLHLRSQKAN